MNENKPGNPWAKSLMIWMAVLFGLVLMVQMFDGGRAATGAAMPYSQFVREVDEGNIKSVTVASSASGNSAIAGHRRSKPPCQSLRSMYRIELATLESERPAFRRR